MPSAVSKKKPPTFRLQSLVPIGVVLLAAALLGGLIGPHLVAYQPSDAGADTPAQAPTPDPPREPDAAPPQELSPEPAGCPQGCTEHKPGCDIKGNISYDHIYHLPGQRYYPRTIISPEKGERWFCTEEEAVANGWRKSKR